MNDRQLFKLNLWLFVAICLLELLTSCSPLAAYEPTPTTTAGTVPIVTTTPIPYWKLATVRPRLNINPANYSGRIGY